VPDDRGASLELRGLVKRYSDVVALDGISLTIPAGEFVTLLGPSGSGKTTTLNLVAGFVKPDEGHIEMDGTPIETLPPHRRNIGMVFQNYALFPHMTVNGNVAFPLKQRKRSKAEITLEVGSALEMVGLKDHGSRYPRELSGGQQQRVALARALVFRPRALLMDEPLGALDKRKRESLQLEFKRIQSELGITFVYVTHDQDEALVMSDTIAVFNEGQIEQVGGAEDLYERPTSLFVAQFLGDSNVLPGRLVALGRAMRLRGEGYELALPKGVVTEAGLSTAVVIRPERLTVVPEAGEATQRRNVLSGQVVEVIYMGAVRRLKIDIPGSVRMIVQEQAGRGSAVKTGMTVLVSWDPEDEVLLSPHSRTPTPRLPGQITLSTTTGELH
jgi:putative spermidine/putrescine transport system ATP-binding protein